MAKLTLSDLANITGNEQSAITTINNNSAAIEAALENTLSRDGTAPNAMGADLDLNGFDIINVANIFVDGEIIEADVVAEYLDFNETSEPASPSANTARLYGRDVSSATRLAYKTSDGTIVPVGIAAADSLALTNISQTGYHDLTEIAAPSSPSSNVSREYARDVNGVTHRFAKDSTGRNRIVTPTVFNVLEFGAIGDGTTDDTAAIQAAATASAGNVLYFPAGNYLVDAATASLAIALPTTGIRVQGAGKYLSRLVLDAAADCAIMGCIDGDKVEIDGLGFDGGGNTTRLAWQRGLVLRGCQDVVITNCRFEEIGDGTILAGKGGFGGSDNYGEGTRQPKRFRVTDNEFFNIGGTVTVLSKFSGWEDVNISDNYFSSAGTIAISIENEDADVGEIAKRTVISGNVINGVSYLASDGFSDIAWGISVGELAQDCTIVGNVIDSVAGNTISAGIEISTSPSQDDTVVKSVIVSANTIRNVTAATGRGFGVLVQAGDTSATDVTIQGNTIVETEDGIGLDCDSGVATTGYVRGISLVGNVIEDSTEFGIMHLTVGSSGSLPLVDSVISGNVIRNSGSHGVTGFFQDCVISGNNIKDSGGTGLSVLTGSSRLTITGNDISRSQTHGIQGAFTNSIISGNISKNNGVGGGTNYGCQITSGGGNLIEGNSFIDTQGGSATQTHGFRTATTSDVARNNDVWGNVTSGIFSGSAANIGTFDISGNRSSLTGVSYPSRVGFQTGTGGTVTQATSKATGVTLNTVCGAITMNNASLAAATIVSFTLTNSAIANTDVLILNHISGGTVGSYTLNAQCGAGSAVINLRNNTAGALGEAVVIQFALVKAVNA